MAMQRFYFSIKKNINQFIYPSYGFVIGIEENSNEDMEQKISPK